MPSRARDSGGRRALNRALTTKELLREILKTRAAQGVLVVGIASLAGAVWVALDLGQRARQGSCEVKKHRELSIDELIAVKKRLTAYRKNPDEGIRLSSAELAMVIEDQTSAPVFLQIEDASFRAELALAKDEQGCWPVAVEGEVSIEDSKAFVIPHGLVLGALDLSSFVDGLRVELLPEHMPSARSANLLSKTRAAAVVDGGIRVELADPNASLFTND